MHDIHPNFQKRVKEFLQLYNRKIHEYDEMVTGNIIFQNRMKNVGVISAEDAISWGCTGPVARGSGVSCDIRKLYPYEVYDKVEFDEMKQAFSQLRLLDISNLIEDAAPNQNVFANTAKCMHFPRCITPSAIFGETATRCVLQHTKLELCTTIAEGSTKSPSG